jgi:hypothetical protein
MISPVFLYVISQALRAEIDGVEATPSDNSKIKSALSSCRFRGAFGACLGLLFRK